MSEPRLAVDAYDFVGDRLRLGTHELAAITGVSHRSYSNWKKTGAQPRPSTVRRLWQIDAVVQSLIKVLGEGGFQLWLRSPIPNPTPSPLHLLMRGEMDKFQQAASPVIFSDARASTSEPFAFRIDGERRSLTTQER